MTSERKLVEELQMHLAWRWFAGLSFNQEVPHHSTFSNNRHGRVLESNLFQQLFEEIVGRWTEAGLVEGQHLSVSTWRTSNKRTLLKSQIINKTKSPQRIRIPPMRPKDLVLLSWGISTTI